MSRPQMPIRMNRRAVLPMQSRSQKVLLHSRALAGLAAACVVASAALASCGGAAAPRRPPPDPAAAFRPKDGTYRYSTRGFESVDALLGARHRYPDTTSIQVSRSSCGYAERWIARRERHTQFDYCVSSDGSRRLNAINDYHEFFGYPEDQRYQCSGARVAALAKVARGFSWTDRCRSRTTLLVLKGKVLGRALLHSARGRIKAVHLYVVARSKGHSAGRTTYNTWLEVPGGLLVQRDVTGSATTGTPAGRVHSEERYRLKLAAGPSGH